MSDGGSAQPVVPVTTGLVSAAPALRVAVVSDGRPTLGGPSLPVYVVTDNRPTQGNTPVPVVLATGQQAGNVMAGPAIPVVVVSGSLNPAPVNTVLPSISGTLNLGQLLTASTGTWTNSPTGYTYQWQRGGVNIGGATANTYTTVLADVGQTLTVIVTASNASGAGAPATSAGSVVFTPTSLSGLRLWTKADSLALADGAAVTSWADSSNANAYIQGTGSAQPTYSTTNAINSLPVVSFDGGDTLTKTGANLPITTAASVFVVHRPDTTGADKAFFGVGSGGTLRRFSLQQTGTGFIYYENGAAAYNAFGAGYIVNNTPYLVELIKSGATIKTYVNQTLKRTDGTGVTISTTTDVTIGSVLSTNFNNKHIAEILIYDSALSDADRASVEIYLGKKYGLF